MTRTVVALYDDFRSASNAVRDLMDAGFVRDEISLMASDMEGEYSRHIGAGEIDERMDTESGAAEGAGVGAGIGAVIGGLGGLLVGLGALTIPGIGPVIAAGPLSAALTGLAGAGAGAVAGGVTGGLIGALVDMGVPEESAHYYAEGVRRGGTLVSARVADNRTNEAVTILNRHDPVDINERVSTWRESGWSTFDPNTEPYTSMGMENEGYVRERPGEPIRADQDKQPDPFTSTSAGVEGEGYVRKFPDEPVRADLAYTDFSEYDPAFRSHFESSMMDTGYSYEQYLPAYRYGYDLATNDRFTTVNDWNHLEPEARRYWDERNPGTWERFKDAVRHAWAEVKDIAS